MWYDKKNKGEYEGRSPSQNLPLDKGEGIQGMGLIKYSRIYLFPPTTLKEAD
jgi:hypothetical protein